MRDYPEIAIRTGGVLLPRAGINLLQWAVIACDQFTSHPDYWQKARELVADSPSTLDLVLPEVYLEEPDVAERIQAIHQSMQDYLARQLLSEVDSLILVERTAAGHTRHGILVALDLEHYDFRRGSTTLIRASEDTIQERIPPRVRIREKAPLEFPHIMVMLDDPAQSVIEPLVAAKSAYSLLYDTHLMLGSGSVKGYAVSAADETIAINALRALSRPESFAARYQVAEGTPPLLFAVGDGNHSLASAKIFWESQKSTVGMNHPARYALVELQNIHDPGIHFEPIHRVLFNLHQPLEQGLQAAGIPHLSQTLSYEALLKALDEPQTGKQVVGVITAEACSLLEFTQPTANLAVGSLQNFLDGWLKAGAAERIDYIHGTTELHQLASQPGNLGFFVPVMKKSEMFPTVIRDGVLARKAFSMGEALEKRFYLEGRRILIP